MKGSIKRIICVVLAFCLLISTGVFFASSMKIDEKNIIWDFEDGTLQSWGVDRPDNLGMSVQQVAGSKALCIDYKFNDKTAQSWWDTAGIINTSNLDLSQYNAITMDVILDLSAISGYGYLAVQPCFNTPSWDFIKCDEYYIYETPAGIDDGKLVKISVTCELPENLSQVSQVFIWFIGGAIDYNGSLYVDNIGFVKGTPEEIQEVETISVPYKTPVEKHGKLQVIGTQLCDEEGEPIQLRGVFTDILDNEFINRASFQAVAYDWKCDLIRLGLNLGTDALKNYQGTQEQKDQIYKGIELAIETGMYVIVDWHTLNPGNPNDSTYSGVDNFFRDLSERYADCPNIIYEICNEPNGSNVTWAGTIKPYAERLRDVIRANDPDGIIIVGTGTWSQDVDLASMSPLTGKNLMYTFHFYCGTHTLSSFSSKIQTALNNGIAVFVTEWGVSDHTGAIGLYLDEADGWLDFLDSKKISWVNFVVSNSGHTCSTFVSYIPTGNTFDGVIEKFACPLVPFTDSGKGYLYWPTDQLSPSGQYVRNKILAAYVEEPTIPDEPNPEQLKVTSVTAGTNNTVTHGESFNFSIKAEGGTQTRKYSVCIMKDGYIHYLVRSIPSSATTYQLNDLCFYGTGEYSVIVYVSDLSGQFDAKISNFIVTKKQ